ncbi:MAG: TlpA family protein disulfide reductase [bacterium]
MPSLLLGAAVLVVAVVLVLQSDVGAPPVVRGSTAPAFDLPRLESDQDSEGAPQATDRLSLADLRGRVVLVNFWATWCEPCESEMPAMDRLHAALPSDEFELVAVSIDEDPEDVAAFQAKMELSFPILLDPSGRVYEAYQTMGVPESLLIDRDGRIVERYVGPRVWDAREYEDRIRALIVPEEGRSPTATGAPGQS